MFSCSHSHVSCLTSALWWNEVSVPCNHSPDPDLSLTLFPFCHSLSLSNTFLNQCLSMYPIVLLFSFHLFNTSVTLHPLTFLFSFSNCSLLMFHHIFHIPFHFCTCPKSPTFPNPSLHSAVAISFTGERGLEICCHGY